jgi:hypothetical protein
VRSMLDSGNSTNAMELAAWLMLTAQNIMDSSTMEFSMDKVVTPGPKGRTLTLSSVVTVTTETGPRVKWMALVNFNIEKDTYSNPISKIIFSLLTVLSPTIPSRLKLKHRPIWRESMISKSA